MFLIVRRQVLKIIFLDYSSYWAKSLALLIVRKLFVIMLMESEKLAFFMILFLILINLYNNSKLSKFYILQ